MAFRAYSGIYFKPINGFFNSHIVNSPAESPTFDCKICLAGNPICLRSFQNKFPNKFLAINALNGNKT